MFHIPFLCERRAKRAMTRVSDARFGVHFFAANAIINSPLHCWVLDGERARLWKSLSARSNGPHTIARRACAITPRRSIKVAGEFSSLQDRSRELRGRLQNGGPRRKVMYVLRAASFKRLSDAPHKIKKGK
jgi:hypothetical protein